MPTRIISNFALWIDWVEGVKRYHVSRAGRMNPYYSRARVVPVDEE